MRTIALILVVTFAVIGDAAWAVGIGPVRMLTGTGSSRTTIPATSPMVSERRFTLQNLGAAAGPLFCEYGICLPDGGTKNLIDGGEPLVATINGRGDYLVFPGDPFPMSIPGYAFAIACIAEDAGTKLIAIKPMSP